MTTLQSSRAALIPATLLLLAFSACDAKELSEHELIRLISTTTLDLGNHTQALLLQMRAITTQPYAEAAYAAPLTGPYTYNRANELLKQGENAVRTVADLAVKVKVKDADQLWAAQDAARRSVANFVQMTADMVQTLAMRREDEYCGPPDEVDFDARADGDQLRLAEDLATVVQREAGHQMAARTCSLILRWDKTFADCKLLMQMCRHLGEMRAQIRTDVKDKMLREIKDGERENEFGRKTGMDLVTSQRWLASRSNNYKEALVRKYGTKLGDSFKIDFIDHQLGGYMRQMVTDKLDREAFEMKKEVTTEVPAEPEAVKTDQEMDKL